MLERIAILLEIVTVFVCVYRLYDSKVKFDISTIGLILVCAVIYDLANAFGAGYCYTVAVYVLIVIYCVRKYDDSILGAVYSLCMMILVMAVMQFFFLVLINWSVDLNESERIFYTNLLVLGSCAMILPKLKICRLRAYTKKWSEFLCFLVVFPMCMVLYMKFLQGRFGEIQLTFFVFGMPMLASVLILMGKWIQEQNERNDLEKELKITKSMQEQYDELVKSVRLRQHEFKNHLTAIFATHYTYKSYEKLVKAQEKYCGGLVQENKYNDLLSLGNIVLVGFLHEKFFEIEKDGVEVKFTIMGTIKESCIPAYYMVEMIGILLDNAFQAVQGIDSDKVVRFFFFEDAEGYHFKISNPFPYVSYDEIEAWFQLGKSTKGKGHGLGLYRVRSLCREMGCSISYRSVEEAGKNWIEFELILGKAD